MSTGRYYWSLYFTWTFLWKKMNVRKKKTKKKKCQLIYFLSHMVKRHISRFPNPFPSQILILKTNVTFCIWLTVFWCVYFMILDVNWVGKASTISINNHFGGYPLTYLWWGRFGESTDMYLNRVTKKNSPSFSFFAYILFKNVFT